MSQGNSYDIVTGGDGKICIFTGLKPTNVKKESITQESRLEVYNPKYEKPIIFTTPNFGYFEKIGLRFEKIILMTGEELSFNSFGGNYPTYKEIIKFFDGVRAPYTWNFKEGTIFKFVNMEIL
jgi:hypothetical protein